MMYAKLENGKLIHAPDRMRIGGFFVLNPTAEQYATEGWLPVEHTDPTEPDVIPEGMHPVSHWVDAGGKITEEWTLEDIPTPEPPAPPPRDPQDVRMDEIEMALMELAAMQGGVQGG